MAIPRVCSQSADAQDEIENAIRATLPTEPGTRHRQVFRLARALKGIPALANLPGAAFREIVARWHALALPRITTKPFEETWIDFLKGWPRVRTPLTLSLMENAMCAARASTEQVPYGIPKLRLLVLLCRELQRVVNDNPFFLSCRTGARLLDVDPTTVSRWLFLLVEDRWLRIVERGGTPANPRKATRFRYVGPPEPRLAPRPDGAGERLPGEPWPGTVDASAGPRSGLAAQASGMK